MTILPPEAENRPAKVDDPQRNPDLCRDEILPSGWHDYAERKRIPDEQIYRSWRRFKELSAYPWRYMRWTRWIDRERVGRSNTLETTNKTH